MEVLQEVGEQNIPTESASEDEKEDVKGNDAWASVLQNVLRVKTLNKKSIVLSKAKKLSQLTKETDDSKNATSRDSSVSSRHLQKRDWISKGRKKPSILEKDKEKTLQKLAVKGVVQLFNAVSTHQKSIEAKLKSAGSSERKQEQVLKSIDKAKFFSLLENKTKTPVDSFSKAENGVKTEENWEVLKEDFMTGRKLKDWDKNENK